jgi:hypothetical protein
MAYKACKRKKYNPRDKMAKNKIMKEEVQTFEIETPEPESEILLEELRT